MVPTRSQTDLPRSLVPRLPSFCALRGLWKAWGRGYMWGRVMASSPNLRDLQKKISDQIQCAICHDDCNQPKSLPCCHVYCKACLERLPVRKENRTIECPTCRKLAEVPQEGMGGFQTAFHITNLKEIHSAMQSTREVPKILCGQCPNAIAVGFCQTCNKFICELCKGVHEKWPSYSDHDVMALGLEGSLRSEASDTCSHHPFQQLSVFCDNCEQILCPTCAEGSKHSNHRRKSLTEAIYHCKDAITSNLHPVKEHQSSVDVATVRVNTKISHVTRQAEDTKNQIDADIARILSTLERRRHELKKEVDRVTDRKVQALKSQKEKLEVMQSQLSGYVGVVEQCLKKGSNRQVLVMRDAVQERVKEISSEYFNQIQIVPVEEANLLFLPDEQFLKSSSSFGDVFASAVCPSKCYVSGRGLQTASLGETASLSLFVYTQDGNPCKEDLQHVTMELVSTGNDSIAGKVTKKKEGNEFALSYHPTTTGTHTLYIRINAKNIQGSPFSVVVYPILRFHGTFVNEIDNFRRPWGIAINQRDQIVVIDNMGWKGIHIFNRNGTAVDSFSDYMAWSLTAKSEGQCYEPRGVALDSSGNILIVDGKNNRIQKFSPTGCFLAVVGAFGKKPLEFSDPVGIAVGESDEIYVCDRRNQRIQVLSSNFQFIREFGQAGDGPGDFLYPWDVTLDSMGNVYVADCGHYCIKVFSPEGSFIRKIGKQGSKREEFKHISSICIDRNDFLYVVDKEQNCISVFHSSGDFVMRFGTPGQMRGQFYDPMGIAVDNSGRVYVSDSYNGRVQIFQ